MKLNVGVSRKVGLPDYSSVGASCGIELEVTGSLLEQDLDRFHAQVRDAYAVAHQAVHDELARLQAPVHDDAAAVPPIHARPPARNGSWRANENDHSTRIQVDRLRLPKPATPSQVRAITAIARRQNTDLPGLLRHEYEVERPEDLTIRQASKLIDLLKNTDPA
jgi:hypothetical protein